MPRRYIRFAGYCKIISRQGGTSVVHEKKTKLLMYKRRPLLNVLTMCAGFVSFSICVKHVARSMTVLLFRLVPAFFFSSRFPFLFHSCRTESKQLSVKSNTQLHIMRNSKTLLIQPRALSLCPSNRVGRRALRSTSFRFSVTVFSHSRIL